MLKLPVGDFQFGEFCQAQSISQAMRELRLGRPVVASGDNGSLTIWVEPGPFYRVQFHVYRATQDDNTLPTKKAVKKWLSDTWTKLGR